MVEVVMVLVTGLEEEEECFDVRLMILFLSTTAARVEGEEPCVTGASIGCETVLGDEVERCEEEVTEGL